MTSRQSRWAYTSLLFVLVAVCGVFLWRTMQVLTASLPLDPNEGWNAYHALSAFSALYPPAESYLVNNYPPLSFYLVGALHPLIGDAVIAGRVLSVLAMFVVALSIYTGACRMGAARRCAVFGALFFVGGLLVFTTYAGMNDPQLLAHAFSVSAFVLLMYRRKPGFVVLAATLFVAAFFIKHNIVVLAVVSAVWLMLTDRSSFRWFVISGIAWLFAGLVLFQIFYGMPLWQVFASARGYSLDLLQAGVCKWLIWSLIPLCGMVALLLRHRDRWFYLVLGYVVLATAAGVYFIGGAGVDANALFDADIALSFGVALLLSRTPQRAGWALLLITPLIWGGWQHIRDYGPADFFAPQRVIAQADDDIAFLQHQQGPALCAMLSFCYWSGKSGEVDFFNTGEAFAMGARSDADLVHRIERADYAAIQFDPDSEDALGPNVHAAVLRYYRLDHSDDFGSFYVPR